MEKIDPREYQHWITKQARLPSDELVLVLEVKTDGSVTVQRIGGDRAGTIAVCKIEELTLEK
jgi:hypothetical protein